MKLLFGVQFLIFSILQIFDFITTKLAYKIGLGEAEINPFANLLMTYNLLWVGKVIAVVVIALLCFWLLRRNQKKLAFLGLSINNCIYIFVVGLNLVSLRLVL